MNLALAEFGVCCFSSDVDRRIDVGRWLWLAPGLPGESRLERMDGPVPVYTLLCAGSSVYGVLAGAFPPVPMPAVDALI